MINYNHKKLTDGRLGSSAVGSHDSRLAVARNTQSNYLVSNDGMTTMDLPRNYSAPRSAEPTNRKTPVLIPPIKYIVYNNPQVSYDFLINKGLNVEPTIPSTLQFAMSYIKQTGDQGILEFVNAAHPDKEVIIKAMAQAKESSFAGDVSQENTDTKQEVKKDTETPKTESKVESWFKLNSQTIIIILIIIVFFLMVRPGK